MKRAIKNKIGKLVEVLWFDACNINEEDSSKYEGMKKIIKKQGLDGTEFLVKNNTKGILKDVFDAVVIIEIESSDDDSLELVAIPRSQIITPEYLQE